MTRASTRISPFGEFPPVTGCIGRACAYLKLNAFALHCPAVLEAPWYTEALSSMVTSRFIATKSASETGKGKRKFRAPLKTCKLLVPVLLLEVCLFSHSMQPSIIEAKFYGHLFRQRSFVALLHFHESFIRDLICRQQKYFLFLKRLF